ncbi:MAG: MATE family efflux transporter [Ruminococcaceae bacterium]|nr:MATE family efflux transporter [Oscillospiraceae bacterium]
MSTAQARKNIDLTSGALLPKMLLFALPLMLTGILQLLFNTADTVVVGRWGGSTPEECENALAAVGSCGSLIGIIVNFFMGLSVGAGVCAAQAFGAKQYDEVGEVVHTAAITAVVCGTAVAVVGMIFCRPLLQLMGTDPVVLDQAAPYMIAYFAGAPANMLYNYCAAILRAKGDTSHPLLFLSIAGCVNVALNLVMVLVFGLGAVGVGIATASAHWVACLLVVIHMRRLDDPCHLSFKRLRIYPQKLRKMLYIGIPAGIQSTVFSFSNVLIQSSINSFGKATVAANTAAANICDYIYIAQNSLYHAAMNFVGQCVGGRRYERIRPITLTAVCIVVVIGSTMGLCLVAFGEHLIALFSPGNPEVIRIGMIRIFYMGIPYFLAGVMEVGSGVLRGLGRSFTSMVIAIMGSCVFRVSWIFFVFPHFRTLESLYISYPISWLLTAAAHFTFVAIAMRKYRTPPQSELLRRVHHGR